MPYRIYVCDDIRETVLNVDILLPQGTGTLDLATPVPGKVFAFSKIPLIPRISAFTLLISSSSPIRDTSPLDDPDALLFMISRRYSCRSPNPCIVASSSVAAQALDVRADERLVEIVFSRVVCVERGVDEEGSKYARDAEEVLGETGGEVCVPVSRWKSSVGSENWDSKSSLSTSSSEPISCFFS